MKIQLKIPNIASNSYYKNNIENFNQLKTIVENFPKNWNKKIHMKTNQSLLKWINDITPLLNDKFFTLKTKIYWILYDIKTFPLCKQCKKPLNHWNVKTLTSPYANFCSQKCRANNKDTQLKKEQTCKKLYGAKSIMQSEYGKQQYKNAMLKTYGVDNPQKVPSIRQKTNATCQTLFGGNAPICLQSIKSQIQQTNNDTYGGICPMKSKDVVKKFQLQRPEIKWEITFSDKSTKFNGDYELWETILDNLLNNFMRYAVSEIKITIKNRKIYLYNDGENIDENIVNNIFNPYTKGIKGQFGLGLSIVKKSLALINYEVSVRNEKKGITFIIK